MHSYTILVGGCARTGKSLMGRCILRFLAENNICAKEYAFANELKKECNPFTLLNLGISSFTEDDDEKPIIRSLLRCWGTDIWRKLDKDHWIKKVELAIKNDSTPHIAVINDGRFENEVLWAQKSGFVIHLERTIGGEILPPNNKDEQENDPIVKELANYRHVWPTFGDDHANLGYYNVSELMRMLFADQINTWQKDFPPIKI